MRASAILLVLSAAIHLHQLKEIVLRSHAD